MRFFVTSALLVTIYFFSGAQSQETIAKLGIYKNCCPTIDILFDPKESVDCRQIDGGLRNVHWLPGPKPLCGIPVCGDGKYHGKLTCGVGECNWASCECEGGCIDPSTKEEALASFHKNNAEKIVSARLSTWTDA